MADCDCGGIRTDPESWVDTLCACGGTILQTAVERIAELEAEGERLRSYTKTSHHYKTALANAKCVQLESELAAEREEVGRLLCVARELKAELARVQRPKEGGE